MVTPRIWARAGRRAVVFFQFIRADRIGKGAAAGFSFLDCPDIPSFLRNDHNFFGPDIDANGTVGLPFVIDELGRPSIETIGAKYSGTKEIECAEFVCGIQNEVRFKRIVCLSYNNTE